MTTENEDTFSVAKGDVEYELHNWSKLPQLQSQGRTQIHIAIILQDKVTIYDTKNYLIVCDSMSSNGAFNPWVKGTLSKQG
jgi:hypothetical protein